MNKTSKITKKYYSTKHLIILGVLASCLLVTPIVKADVFDQQINDLNQKNAQNHTAVLQLEQQATSYQDAVNRLQSQIQILQGQITNNQAKQVSIQSQIDAAKKKLDEQKLLLGADVRQMYVDGQISTLEMLASSNNLSDFADKQQYRSTVQNKIQNTLDQITALETQLREQKQQVDQLLKDEQAAQQQVASDISQQNQLLSYNQQQQSSYNQQTKDNQAKINQLIAQQRAANNVGRNGSFIAGATSYPFAHGGFGMSPGACVNNDGPDPWGYCTRQCVSYAAWAVAHSGRNAPMYYGDAWSWVGNALRDNIPVYSFSNVDGYHGVQSGAPQPGDVAISTHGTWGHAMYIESVNGTQIYVSQYNANLDGQFSYQWRDASNYYFLRFP